MGEFEGGRALKGGQSAGGVRNSCSAPNAYGRNTIWRDVEFHRSAFKHGFNEAAIRHAVDHALAVIDLEPDSDPPKVLGHRSQSRRQLRRSRLAPTLMT